MLSLPFTRWLLCVCVCWGVPGCAHGHTTSRPTTSLKGYVPKVCCCDFPEMGRGDSCCMWLEGCLCDTLSLSFTRIYLMDAKQLHPDPVDYQIIRFSNCMQVTA